MITSAKMGCPVVTRTHRSAQSLVINSMLRVSDLHDSAVAESLLVHTGIKWQNFSSSSSDIYNQGREATGNDLKPSFVTEDREKKRKETRD